VILAVRIIDTVEVSGSNPLLPTIPFNNLRGFPGFRAAPPRSNKALTDCIHFGATCQFADEGTALF